MSTGSSKSCGTKNVDDENKGGFYLGFKSLIKKIADVIIEMDRKFSYTHSFARNLFEMAYQSIFSLNSNRSPETVC